MPSPTGHTSLALKVGEWQVLPLPRDNDVETIEVGVLELLPNPSLNRSSTQHVDDVAKTKALIMVSIKRKLLFMILIIITVRWKWW